MDFDFHLGHIGDSASNSSEFSPGKSIFCKFACPIKNFLDILSGDLHNWRECLSWNEQIRVEVKLDHIGKMRIKCNHIKYILLML